MSSVQTHRVLWITKGPSYCVRVKLDGSWPERLNVKIGEQIGRFRKARGLTAAQLAERCTELGLPISRSKIANMENGRARQEGISVAEVSIIAAALDVPPILLIYPVGREETTEVLPSQEVPSWSAAQWFSAENPLPTKVNGEYVVSSDAYDAWQPAAAPVAYHQEQDKLVRAWNWQSNEPSFNEVISDVEKEIGVLRRSMRRAGIRPGDLPNNLRHVDEEASQ